MEFKESIKWQTTIIATTPNLNLNAKFISMETCQVHVCSQVDIMLF